MKTLARIGAGLSFTFCLLGGVWILTKTGFDRSGDEVIWTGMGLYFVGKAFFVGPMLWLAAENCCSKKLGNDHVA
jgi:hypothetical protein